MTITHQEGHSGGAYTMVVGDETAKLTYSRASPSLIIVDHTEVPDAMRGQGIGQKLAAHAVEAARLGGWKIVPLCPFFRSQVERHPEWRDVISA
ncbi:N-acetyltransferase [Ciceribacter sp. L1K23]|uniref:GNAT family N-acetyltransferase n=1 Tax=Ciceribacter sp. L1K23 TaxID=2820276 RepID=UPI001B8321CC|nr:GNAT family N-acetyltransferase [Ciceribacter sp. L1K23]MBR0554770.1 N-acetyltransferase [Ciceribacter sp. L1K23]